MKPLTRRAVLAAGAAGTIRAQDDQFSRMGNMVYLQPPPDFPLTSATLIRAAAGISPDLQAPALSLLGAHLRDDIGLYDRAGQWLRTGPRFAAPDLGTLETIFASVGLSVDRAQLAPLLGQAARTDLHALAAPGALERAMRPGPAVILHGRRPASGSSFLPLDENTTLITGAAVLVAGGSALAGIGMGMTGGTFASGALAAGLITGGAAVIVVGLAIGGYALFRALTS